MVSVCITFAQNVRGSSLILLFSQKTSIVSTLRRLGEELYKPRVVKFNEETSGNNTTSHNSVSLSPPRTNDKKELKEGTFFKSSNIHVRILSSLIILKTLTQGKNNKSNKS